jgi:hypothetical protein
VTDRAQEAMSKPRGGAAFDAIRLIHELTETMLLFHDADDLTQHRLEKLRDYIRETYDESVWEP